MGKVILVKFSDICPDRISWWDPTLNDGKNAKDLLPKATKIWFRCPEAKDHVFQRALNDWGNKKSCPYCKGLKVAKSNSLATINPEIASEFHPTKNGDLTPDKIFWSTAKKVWWLCPEGSDHEWQMEVYKRTREKEKYSCPFCKKKRASKAYSLATEHPELAKEWHPTKNKDLLPSQVLPGTSREVWWLCEKGHSWKCKVLYRKRLNCPDCNKIRRDKNSFGNVYPEYVEFWDNKKNKKSPFEVAKASNTKYWFKCSKGHVFDRVLSSISKSSFCPTCYHENRKFLKNREQSLAVRFPEIAKFWHPTKNLPYTTENVSPYKAEKFWFTCPEGEDHVYEQLLTNKVKRGDGCPVCKGTYNVPSKGFKKQFKEIANQWHPTKNGDLKPEDFTQGSSKKVWWLCPEGSDHEWEAMIGQRTRLGTGCPFCDGQRICSTNNLAYLKPDYFEEWHPTKNTVDPSTIGIADSKHKPWWLCKHCGNEWQTSCNNRNKGKGCSLCDLTPQSRQELTITFELMTIFGEIDPKGFKTRLNGRMRSVDIYVPELKLAIEFDGSYWHKNKQQMDKLKTKLLNEQGHKVIRIRQEPLRKLTPNDIICAVPYDGKKVTDDVLGMILDLYTIDSKTLKKIDSYLSKRKLQNEKNLDNYVNFILSKKAGKSTGSFKFK